MLAEMDLRWTRNSDGARQRGRGEEKYDYYCYYLLLIFIIFITISINVMCSSNGSTRLRPCIGMLCHVIRPSLPELHRLAEVSRHVLPYGSSMPR